MGQVSVPVAAFRDRQLPLVCVKTGREAERMVAVQAVFIPVWTWWLFLLGPLVLQLARWLLRRQVTGWVPMCRSAAHRLERVRRFGWASLLAGVVPVLLGGLAGWPDLARPGVVALAVGIVAELVSPLWSVGARLDRAGGRVVLTRVHPGFCEAVADGGVSAGRPAETPPRGHPEADWR
jgi:hypothetical protein